MTKRMMLFLLVALIGLALASDAMAANDCSAPVETGQGVFVGYADDDYDAYNEHGVPYRDL